MFFTFTDIYGNEQRMPESEAQRLLGCTLRTIQNYRDPSKRDPVKWHLLELYATGRVLPNARFKEVSGTLWLCLESGKSVEWMAIDQAQHYYSMLNAEKWQIHRELEAAREEIASLRRHLETVGKSTGCSNVVPFPPRQRREIPANVVDFPRKKEI